MKTQTRTFICTLTAAFAVAGCGGGGYDEPPPQPQPQPPTQPQAESFTDWSKNGVFAKPAEGAPENMDTLVWNFDGDDNPNAYSELLPPET
jgi:hypothetical protein